MKHVLVRRPREGETSDVEAWIIKAIGEKQKKGGSAYARGETLVVFLNSGGGLWTPNRVARNLPPHDFGAIWVVGLRSVHNGEYLYNVTNLHLDLGNAPTFTVDIGKGFASWPVQWLQ